MKSAPARTLLLTSVLAFGLGAQSNAPYHGPTGVPNNAARNDQPNTALSGTTPETNSSLQETRNGNMGFDLGWLGLFGLAGLFGLRRGATPHTHDAHQHEHSPQMSRG